MHDMQQRILFPILALILTLNLLACGVKGPPEPPFPTEASTKKIPPPTQTVETPNSPLNKPIDVPFATGKTPGSDKANKKQKKKSQ